MSKKLKIGLIQNDPITADLSRNLRQIVQGYRECLEHGADIVVASAHALCGAGVKDLAKRISFLQQTEDAIETLGRLAKEPYYQHDGEDYYVGVAEATGEIHSMPAVEVKEVVHAKWEKPVLIDGHWYRTCSNCFYGSAHGAYGNKEFMPMFCSNCGAIMDKV